MDARKIKYQTQKRCAEKTAEGNDEYHSRMLDKPRVSSMEAPVSNNMQLA